MARDGIGWMGWPAVVQSARTAVAAIASLLVARMFRLQEAYWAPITALSDRANIAGWGANGFLAAIFRNSDWGGGWCDRG